MAIAQLPELSSDYALTKEQVESFRRDGFVLLRGLCSAEEVAAYRGPIRETAMKMNKEKRKLEDRDAYGKAFLQTLNLRLHSDEVKKFVLARRFGKVAAELMGVKGTRIFHEQALFKEPKGGGTPWHQDQYYWPMAEPTMCGLWMPLVDCTEAMGVLKFAAGTHRKGFLGQHAISDESQKTYEEMIRKENVPVVFSDMKAGDATFHYGWTLHGSGPNLSETLREAMVVTFYADGMRVAKPTNGSQENDRVRFLGGREVGAVADSELNTVLYKEGVNEFGESVNGGSDKR